MMRFNAGFTLIEVLIASLVLIIVLGIAVSGLVNGGKTTGTIVSRSDLIEDTRMAGQMIADEIGRAVFVYPPGSSITLSAPNAYTVQNANAAGASSTFVIGTDPMVAYIEAPANPALACAPVTSPLGCMTFVAYYAVKRGMVTAAATGASNPGPDPRNNDRWLLYEYRRTLNFAAFTGTSTSQIKTTPSLSSVPAQLTGVNGQLLADGIMQGGFKLSSDAGATICRNGSRLLVDNSGAQLDYQGAGGLRLDPNGVNLTPGCPGATASPNMVSDNPFSSIVQATLTIQAQVTGPEGDVTTPVLSFALAPRNLLLPAL